MSKAFTHTITSEQLKRGLRPSLRTPRNAGFLVESAGMVGREGVLQALDEITRITTTTITDAFPYPQIFVFTNMIIVCGAKTIYEYSGGTLSLKYTAASEGSTWEAVDFYDYVYLSNGVVSVIRDAGSKVYSTSSTQPKATAMCNYNGQVLIGAPDVTGLGADKMIPASPITIELKQIGTMTIGA